MDHNIEDTLTLESDMGSMDFDHSDVVVNQDDITLEDSSQPNISMDLEHIEDQSALMDTGGEEVIISDFMSDQFSFQEYTVQSNNTNDGMIKLDQNQLNVLLSQNEAFNVQLTNTVSSVPSVSSNTEVTTTKGTPGPKPAPKKATAPFPRQVAIAPKPANVPNVQYAIAPKPVALVMNKSAGASVSKKVTIGNIQGNIKANTVLTQIGKQIVMVPTNTAGPRHKIKVIPASSSESGVHFAQIISNKSGAKPVMTKLLVQGQPNQESPNQGQPAVITKLLPVSAANQLNRAKVIITTPTKQNLFKKQQFFAIKTQNPTKVPTTQGNFTTKRVVITSNQSQNVLMKAAASKNVAQVFKDKPVIPSQHTQLHQINVPGKGIQYIKLVTSQAPAQKPKPATPLAVPAKNFVLTDSKGNIIQMAAEKVTSQSTPLMVTGLGANKLQKKLVRIAPMSSKSGTQGMLSVRSSQSLLAPLSVGPTEGTSPAADYTLDHDNVPETNAAEQVIVDKPQHTDKPTLQSIISDAIGDSEECIKMESMENVECVYDSKPMHEKITFMVDEDERNNINQDNSISKKQEESPIIIIPATNYTNQSEDHEESMYSNDTQHMEDSKQNLSLMSMNVEAEVVPYNMSPGSPNEFNDSEVVSSDLGLRPRKACNCTKSQCLKLYCDCFANGEFCNNCNCNNCHNNLQNEELRQKAIRSCLERNPNAFRPKIGKAKAGGPEIIRRHNKGCNCKRSGCLKNYCECYEAKIACTTMCKCVGCRNVEETLDRRRGAMRLREKLTDSTFRPPPAGQVKQPSSFMTVEVIEAVCQCLVAAAAEGGERAEPDAVHDVIEEFARCLQDIIGASHHAL